MPVTDATIAEMRRLVVALDAEVDTATRELTRAYVDAWDTVVGQLRDALLDLAADGPITRTRIERASRVASALQAIADQLDGLAAQAAVVITDRAGQVTSLSVSAQAAIAGTQLSATAGTSWVSVSTDVLDTIVARTGQQITARTRPLAQAGQQAVRTALVRGAASADNPVKVAREMVRLARAGAVDLPLARVEAIARTELLDAARQAQQAWDQANAKTLQGWEWLSSRSTTTCPACWAMDGRLFELAEPGPWGHVNCRCTRMVRTKTWRELGLDLDEPTDVRLPAEDQFRALSRDQQLTIMGPARLRALADGAPWSSLATLKSNADWRPSYQQTPARDLVPA